MLTVPDTYTKNQSPTLRLAPPNQRGQHDYNYRANCGQRCSDFHKIAKFVATWTIDQKVAVMADRREKSHDGSHRDGDHIWLRGPTQRLSQSHRDGGEQGGCGRVRHELGDYRHEGKNHQEHYALGPSTNGML